MLRHQNANDTEVTLTDGRMSGASGSVPGAIHVSPEALDGGMIARLRDGDRLRLDAHTGVLEVVTKGVSARPAASADLEQNEFGVDRELFALFRRNVGPAETGASIFGD